MTYNWGNKRKLISKFLLNMNVGIKKKQNEM